MTRVSLFVCLLLGACSASPGIESIALGTTRSSPVEPSPVQVSMPILEVARVSLPDWLDSTDIVLGTRGGALDISRSAKWAERLSVGASRILSSDIRERFILVTVYEAPAPAPADYRFITQIDKLGCDGRLCSVEARWAVVDRQGAVQFTGQTAMSEPSPADITPQSQAAAIERQIAAIADDAQRHLLTRMFPDAPSPSRCLPKPIARQQPNVDCQSVRTD